MVIWSNGLMVQWSNGSMVKWSNGQMVKWSNGKTVKCRKVSRHSSAYNDHNSIGLRHKNTSRLAICIVEKQLLLAVANFMRRTNAAAVFAAPV